MPFDWCNSLNYCLQVRAECGRVPQAAVIKKQGLLESLAALTMDGKDAHVEVLKLHSAVLKTGCSMVRAVQDYEKLGKDVEQRFAKDHQKMTLLKLCMKSSAQYASAKEALLQARTNKSLAIHLAQAVDEVPSSDEEKPNQDNEDAAAMEEKTEKKKGQKDAQSKIRSPQNKLSLSSLELYDQDTPGLFDAVLSCDLICQAMLKHTSSCMDALATASADVLGVFAGVTGENSWKSTLTGDSTIEDVLQEANGLLKLRTRGQALQDLLQRSAEAWRLGPGPGVNGAGARE